MKQMGMKVLHSYNQLSLRTSREIRFIEFTKSPIIATSLGTSRLSCKNWQAFKPSETNHYNSGSQDRSSLTNEGDRSLLK